MRYLQAGRDAILIDFSDHDSPSAYALAAAEAIDAAAAQGAISDIIDIVPAATTTLVATEPGAGIDLIGIRRVTRTLDVRHEPTSSATTVEIPVIYDGDDLHDVAVALSTSTDEVIAAHTGISWRVEFVGFAPGFGYLVPQDNPPLSQNHPARRLAGLPRRPASRPKVPAGAVAVAAGYSAIYPSASPGGWNLLGHTTTTMFDLAAEQPARLTAGAAVTFNKVTHI